MDMMDKDNRRMNGERLMSRKAEDTTVACCLQLRRECNGVLVCGVLVAVADQLGYFPLGGTN